MATRIGLLRARGRSRGAQLLYGQQQLCSFTGSAGNGSVRFLARLSSSHPTAAAGGRSSNAGRGSSSAPASSLAFSASTGRQQQQQHVAYSLILGRTNSSTGSASCGSAKALFSSTSARPSDDSSSAEMGGDGGGSAVPAPMTFDGSSNKDRLASLDDGDKVGSEAGRFFDRLLLLSLPTTSWVLSWWGRPPAESLRVPQSVGNGPLGEGMRDEERSARDLQGAVKLSINSLAHACWESGAPCTGGVYKYGVGYIPAVVGSVGRLNTPVGISYPWIASHVCLRESFHRSAPRREHWQVVLT